MLLLVVVNGDRTYCVISPSLFNHRQWFMVQELVDSYYTPAEHQTITETRKDYVKRLC